MSISCLMITTNRPERLKMTRAALDSIDANAKCTFKEKVLSIDLLDGVNETGHELDPFSEFVKECLSKGWIVTSGPCTGYRGMINNIKRGLGPITSDKLFYCEDHIVIRKVPEENSITDMFNKGVMWICYNTHIVEQNLLGIQGFVERPDIGGAKMSYINNAGNYYTTNGNEFLIKGEPLIDEYYLNFPAAITTIKVFSLLLGVGCMNYHDIGIEIGFTKAWFDCKLADRFRPAIYLQEGVLDSGEIDFGSIHYYAQMKFRNNDPTMLHPSISEHEDLPKEKSNRNSFF